jgi:hypothetical protein
VVASARTLSERLETLGLVPWGAPLELSPDDVMGVVESASHTGLVALLGAAIDLGAIVVSADTGRGLDTIERVRGVWIDRLATVVVHDALLADVVHHLRQNGIETRVLKGAANAHLDEIDPSWRTYGDADVLVPDGRLMDATDALSDLGLRPLVPPVRRGWADRYAKGVTLQADDGRQLDLHRTLAAGPLGERLVSSGLFANGRSFEVGGRSVTALSDVNRFAHACYHTSLSAAAAHRHRRDVALLAGRVRPVDLDGIADVGWSLTVIADAIDVAAPAGAIPEDWVEWSAAIERSGQDEHLLRAARSTFATAAQVAARQYGGTRQAARYMSALIWPQRAHLVARGLTRRQHLRSLVRHRR